MHVFIWLLFFGIATRTSAQPMPDTLWTRVIGGPGDEDVRAICQTSDGGYIIVGSTNAWGSIGQDVLVAKLDSAGALEWLHHYGGEWDDTGVDVRQLRNGQYVVAANYSVYVDTLAPRVLWLDEVGDTLQTREYYYYSYRTQARAQGLVEVADGSLLLGGSVTFTSDLFPPSTFGWLATIAASGELLASRVVVRGDATAYQTWAYVVDIEPALDGGCFLAGAATSHTLWPRESWSYGLRVSRYGPDGDSLWTTYLPNELGQAVCARLDTGAIVAAVDPVAHAFDAHGVWQDEYPVFHSARDMCPSGSGGFAILSVDSTTVLTVYCFDGTGNWQWDGHYGGPYPVAPRAIEATADGGLVLAGTMTTLGWTDIYLVKTDPNHWVDADRAPATRPLSFDLTAYPNPFNVQTRLAFELPRASRVTLTLYDVTGREVRTLVEGLREAGYHELNLNAPDLPSGIYFARLEAGAFTQTQKLLLVR